MSKTKASKSTRDDVKVTVWEERDRLHIAIVDKATEQISYADWWDDGARQMFEDGFFKPGIIHRQLEQIADAKMTDSVLKYAEDMGILQKREGSKTQQSSSSNAKSIPSWRRF